MSIMTVSGFKVIDGHVNAGQGELKDDPIMSDIDHCAIAAQMDKTGIDQSVIFPTYYPSGYKKANDEILKIIAEFPGKFIPFMRIKSPKPHPFTKRKKLLSWFNAGRPETFGFAPEYTAKEDMARYLTQYKGVKINLPQDGMPSDEIWGMINDKKLPVLLHAGEGIDYNELMETVISRYDFPVILAHFGGYPLRRSLYDASIGLARAYKNIYLGTACVIFQHYLEKAIKAVPEKVLFGSDAPVVTQKAALESILTLNISEEQKRMVLAENLSALLH
ncbi:MAG: amidohydrolase family protein [Planctomycetes bacterium]|nr:amidohydrolase family protein [Planctomycetota bacterium]